MERKIRIRVGEVEALAELNNSKVAGLIWDTLPIKVKASVDRWGDEIYLALRHKSCTY